MLPCLGGGGGLLTKLRLTLVTPWTVTCQAPLSLGFSRQEYWGGLPVPSPGDLPNPGIKPRSPALQADSLPTELLAIVNSMAMNIGVHISFQLRPMPRTGISGSYALPPFFFKLDFIL